MLRHIYVSRQTYNKPTLKLTYIHTYIHKHRGGGTMGQGENLKGGIPPLIFQGGISPLRKWPSPLNMIFLKIDDDYPPWKLELEIFLENSSTFTPLENWSWGIFLEKLLTTIPPWKLKWSKQKSGEKSTTTFLPPLENWTWIRIFCLKLLCIPWKLFWNFPLKILRGGNSPLELATFPP